MTGSTPFDNDGDRPSWERTSEPGKSAMKRAPSTRTSHARFADDVPDDAEHAAKPHNRHGNEISMKKIVDVLYGKVLGDPQLAPFFKDFDVKRIKNQQEVVMAMVFGGADLLQTEIPGFDMRRLHMRPIMERGLGVPHWQLYVNHFKATLDELADELPADKRTSALHWMQSTKDAFKPLTPDEVYDYEARKAASKGGKCPF